MIDVASRATNGVKIPGRKATRAEIMQMFKNHLTRLKKTLSVSCNMLLYCIVSDLVVYRVIQLAGR
jgi:hypothetical protein